jgi:hypothetical protein
VVLLDVRNGAVPVQVVGAKLFQSKLIGACGFRLPSSNSKPAASETGPADAGPEDVARTPNRAKHTADTAAMTRRDRLIRQRVGRCLAGDWGVVA